MYKYDEIRKHVSKGIQTINKQLLKSLVISMVDFSKNIFGSIDFDTTSRYVTYHLANVTYQVDLNTIIPFLT
jgi:hypothetical protein